LTSLGTPTNSRKVRDDLATTDIEIRFLPGIDGDQPTMVVLAARY
jgi:hypothetical protein